MTRAGQVIYLAAIGTTTALLWLSPTMAAEQSLPGATAESVVALARRLNSTLVAAALDFDAAVNKNGTAGVLADPTLVLEGWDVNRQGVAQRRVGIEQERRLRTVQLKLLKLKVEMQVKYAEMERLAGGSL